MIGRQRPDHDVNTDPNLPRRTIYKIMKTKYSIAIILAGTLWGSMGLFTRVLTGYGLTPPDLIIVRVGISAVLFFATILIKDPGAVKVKPSDFWCFIGSGIISLMFFTYCYFNAQQMMSLAAAAILLYLAPAIVMVLSAILFKEPITKTKIAALVLALIGCALVSGVLGHSVALTPKGLLYGLGSAVGYALYSIFARFAINKGYSSTTINAYSCALAAIGAAVIFRPAGFFARVTQSPAVIVWCVIASIVTCYLPYALYTYGLTGVENGKASVMASVEPVVAGIIGVVIFNETPTLASIIGTLLVLVAIVMLNKQTITEDLVD